MNEKWESVHERLEEHGCPTDKTERMLVPGGWLYRTWKSGTSFSGLPDQPDVIAMVFVPEVKS